MNSNIFINSSLKCTPLCDPSIRLAINYIYKASLYHNINNKKSILNIIKILHNNNIPNYLCKWFLNNDGSLLQWNNLINNDDNSYNNIDNFLEWLIFLIKFLFEPNNIKINGVISWFGKNNEDMGKIKVSNNNIKIYNTKIQYVKRNNIL